MTRDQAIQAFDSTAIKGVAGAAASWGLADINLLLSALVALVTLVYMSLRLYRLWKAKPGTEDSIE